MKKLRSNQDEPLDLTLWRNGRRTRGELEAALDNTRGLAAHPPLLPAGVIVNLPDAPAAQPVKIIKLWD